MGYIEVDQSGKVEQFDKDTVVALSNDKTYSVLLPRNVKAAIFSENKSEVRNIVFKMFAVCVYHVLEGDPERDSLVTICREYWGWEFLIKSELLRLLDPACTDKSLIRFGLMGKRSEAHRIALLTQRRQIKPDKVLTKEDIVRYLK